MSNPNFTTTPPLAPPPIQPTAELVAAIADVLRFIAKRQRERQAAAVFADDMPHPDRPPTPPEKEQHY